MGQMNCCRFAIPHYSRSRICRGFPVRHGCRPRRWFFARSSGANRCAGCHYQQMIWAWFSMILCTVRWLRRFNLKPNPNLKLRRRECTLKSLLVSPSALRIQGELARRRLLAPLDLPPQTNNDVLGDSVVQVLVDADGNVLSATLLPPGSGLATADKDALNFAKSARFEPLNREGPASSVNSGTNLTLGDMVFQWQTMPPPVTNSTATTP